MRLSLKTNQRKRHSQAKAQYLHHPKNQEWLILRLSFHVDISSYDMLLRVYIWMRCWAVVASQDQDKGSRFNAIQMLVHLPLIFIIINLNFDSPEGWLEVSLSEAESFSWAAVTPELLLLTPGLSCGGLFGSKR